MIDGNEAAASRRLPRERGVRDLPDHALVADGRARGPVVGEGRTEHLGQRPAVVEMQSEGGAAGAVHGALQGGALTTTFTASQGLLLMIPNMYKIAGELTPAVFHVAARSVAAAGAVDLRRPLATSWPRAPRASPMLASSSVQEAHGPRADRPGGDARGAHPVPALLRRLPHLARDQQDRAARRRRHAGDDRRRPGPRAPRAARSSPDHPVHPRHGAEPGRLLPGPRDGQPVLPGLPGDRRSARWTASPRSPAAQYRLFDYVGAPGRRARHRADGLRRRDRRARPSTTLAARAKRSASSRCVCTGRSRRGSCSPPCRRRVRAIAVLDRTKEPGATGEPLYLDVVTALAEAQGDGRLRGPRRPRVIGGRYGLVLQGVHARHGQGGLRRARRGAAEEPLHGRHRRRRHPHQPRPTTRVLDIEPRDVVRAVFYGLGADGTVGANKNSIKIIGEDTANYAQGYFVYDSKKSGSRDRLAPALRPEADPLDVPDHAGELRRLPPVRLSGAVRRARAGGAGRDVPAEQPARRRTRSGSSCRGGPGADHRQAAAMSTSSTRTRWPAPPAWAAASTPSCRPASSRSAASCRREEAIAEIKEAIKKTYGKRGEVVCRRTSPPSTPRSLTCTRSRSGRRESTPRLRAAGADDAPKFVQQVTAMMIAGHGDELPVSAAARRRHLPDRHHRYEKRNISEIVRGLGGRTSASSAATAASSARTA